MNINNLITIYESHEVSNCDLNFVIGSRKFKILSNRINDNVDLFCIDLQEMVEIVKVKDIKNEFGRLPLVNSFL